ncbi:MAG: hypothetical protein HY905_04120 [Deltaproteobacteria bacterium]|nr:hypothetical protein [Deltaproteobacteria bacterium]
MGVLVYKLLQIGGPIAIGLIILVIYLRWRDDERRKHLPPAPPSEKLCRYCRTPIPYDATVCRWCQREQR